jgi:hypothetical protein
MPAKKHSVLSASMICVLALESLLQAELSADLQNMHAAGALPDQGATAASALQGELGGGKGGARECSYPMCNGPTEQHALQIEARGFSGKMLDESAMLGISFATVHAYQRLPMI